MASLNVCPVDTCDHILRDKRKRDKKDKVYLRYDFFINDRATLYI